MPAEPSRMGAACAKVPAICMENKSQGAQTHAPVFADGRLPRPLRLCAFAPWR